MPGERDHGEPRPELSGAGEPRPITTYLAQEQASEAYDAIARPGELLAPNPSGGFTTTFSAAGLRIESSEDKGFHLAMRTSRYGCKHDVVPLDEAAPEAMQNRVEYRREVRNSEFVEWYVNGPMGLEQGYTLAEPPCRRPGPHREGLTIELALAGDLAPALEDEGDRVVFRDARGQTRLAMLEPRGEDAAGQALALRFTAARRDAITLHIDDTDAVYPIVIDPLITTNRLKLVADETASGHHFGHVAAIHAHTLVVGADGAGAAYVFERDHGLGFLQEAVLRPGAPAPGFGSAVTIWGDTAVIGAPGDAMTQGAVHVFERIDEALWVERARLVPQDSTPGDRFGSAIHLSGDTLIVGAPGAQTSTSARGAAYVFTRSLGVWAQATRLAATNTGTDAEFGAAVTIWRDMAVVGAPGAEVASQKSGAAYVFTRTAPHSFDHTAILAPRQGQAGDAFGASVALWGHTALIGAPGTLPSGASYVYVYESGAWIEQLRLDSPDPRAMEFGAQVAIDGDRAAISVGRMSAHGEPSKAFLFERQNDQWMLAETVVSPGPGADDASGSAVGLTPNTLVIGASWDSTYGPRSGALYAYALQRKASATADLTCADATTLGSLASCIRSQMPKSGSNGFQVPTAAQQDDWRQVVADMLQGNCDMPLPASLAGAMHAQTFIDADNQEAYCVLMEVQDANNNGYVDRGWGTFVVNNAPVRELSHQAPHPHADYLTEVEAIDVFKGTDSRTYLMCGSHRLANSKKSTCDTDYRESDCAHAKTNMYYPTVLELDEFYGAVAHTEIQWHGMADSTCPGIHAYISPGRSTTPPAGSNVLTLRDLAVFYNPSWVVEVPGDDVCDLNATENTEGRYLNGVLEADVCTKAATSASGKFVHIEQQRDYRVAASWIAPVSETWPEIGLTSTSSGP